MKPKPGTQATNPRSAAEVARRLKALRQALGLTQADFARACALTPSDVSNYETLLADRGVPQRIRDAVIMAFGVDDNFVNAGNFWCLSRDPDLLIGFQERLKHPKEPARRRVGREALT